MFSRLTIPGFVVAILCGAGSFVHAQGRGGTSAFGGNSGTGAGGFNTSMGGGGFGSSSFGSGGFGGSRFGSSGTGSSGFGSSGFGSSPFGNSGFGNQGANRTGQGGQQGFIGRDSGDMQALFNQMGSNSNQMMQNMNRMMGGGRNQGGGGNRGRNRSSQNSNQQGKNEKRPVVVRLEVAFDRPLSAEGLTGDNLIPKLRKIVSDHSMTQPDVSIEGGVVVLRGTAVSESERLVLEKFIAMEPGVREVQNLMTVAQPPTGSIPPGTSN